MNCPGGLDRSNKLSIRLLLIITEASKRRIRNRNKRGEPSPKPTQKTAINNALVKQITYMITSYNYPRFQPRRQEVVVQVASTRNFVSFAGNRMKSAARPAFCAAFAIPHRRRVSEY